MTSKAQSAILPEPRENALFLVLKVKDRKKNARAVADAAAQLPAFTRRLESGRRTRLASSVAFGREMWDAVSPKARPPGFAKFRAVKAGARHAPATGGDLLLHVTSRETGVCLDLAARFRDALGKRVRVMEEVQGFRYRDYRDLTGFVDGTENPSGSKRAKVALLGNGHSFAGGSFVFTQRYVHDLAKWQKLSVSRQERVIGRTKQESRELSDRLKPATAHIARVVIEEDGEELEIVRHSFPYGNTTENGLFFIAYTNDLATPTKMLARMMGTSGDGRSDHLMKYTRAVSGAHFFAPSLRTLRSL